MLGFVDAPGHERFVHTMAAGAAGIDFALLAVAADDGVMPQTREHIAILDLLGVGRGLAVITKTDLATPGRLAALEGEIRLALAGTALSDIDIAQVSVVTGHGVAALRERLAAAAAQPPARPADGRFRLAIDRSFTLAGVGAVVTGVVLSGVVRVGDALIVSPSGLAARVRSLHAQNRARAEGRAGERCALNLSGPGLSKDAIKRGDMALDPELHAPAQRIDARLRLLPSEAKAIGSWFPARLHHGAAEVGARVVVLQDDALRPGASADVQLVLERDIAAAEGDRFLLRDVSARRTIGGGRFLDLRAPPRRRRTAERVAQRAARAEAQPEAALAALLAAPPHACDLSIFARDRALSAARAERMIKDMALVTLGSVVMTAERWERFVSGLVERLAVFHGETPDAQGLGRETLRLAMQPPLAAAMFASMLRRAALTGAVVVEGGFVRLPTHRVTLSARDEADWKSIWPRLGGEMRFRPPRTRDIAMAGGWPERDVRRLLKLASRVGRVDEVAPDHFFLRATTREMVEIAADVAAGAESGAFTAAQFRDRLGNGRKVAIQILEFFDRHGVTLRRGEMRRVDPRRLDLFGPLVSFARIAKGGESFPVGRSDFKSEWGGETVSGGFDSHSLPPSASRERP